MHANDYRLIASSPLRTVLRNCCNDPRDLPGRKELRSQLVEALPDAGEDVINALMTKAEELARECVDPGARFDARAKADRLTLKVLRTFEEADRLIPVGEDTTAEDVAQAVQKVDEAANPFANLLEAANARLEALGGKA
ncbi:MAG TPA: hypothetical protein VFA84_05425 [Acidimicrobiales bacterium]|nr:hypothetical protein [Acidimicrobiales bacterium]